MAEFHNPFRRDRSKAESVADTTIDPPLEEAIAQKSLFKRALPVFACGAGLFSDGYINNVSVSVNQLQV